MDTVFDTILVAFHREHTVRALEVCNRLRRFAGRDSRAVLVCNDPELADLTHLPANRHWEVLPGSNRLGEFSGWQEGLDHLGVRTSSVLFVNDSVTVHRKFTAAKFYALVHTLRAANRKANIGFVDYAGGDFRIKGLPVRTWTRTNCFALTADALRDLSCLLWDVPVAEECVRGGLDEAGFFAHLSWDLEERLRNHLFHGGWYASEGLTELSVQRLTFKARCIVLEKWLAARCHAQGIELVDPFQGRHLAKYVDKMRAEPLGVWAAALGQAARRRLGRPA